MDSVPITIFLENTYPKPPLQLTSELGRELEAKGRAAIGPVLRVSILPREINIISPRAQEYFRRTREAVLGCRLEDLLSDGREEKAWRQVENELTEMGKMLLTNEAKGPFVLGPQPSATDFFIAGSLQAAKTVDEGVFSRMAAYPGFLQIYEACLPYMQRVD
jgi:glutathione S-transferase